MTTPTITKTITTRRHLSGLTGKGNAAALLIRVRDQWADLSPSQQAEATEILTRLAACLRREHSVLTRIVA